MRKPSQRPEESLLYAGCWKNGIYSVDGSRYICFIRHNLVYYRSMDLSSLYTREPLASFYIYKKKTHFRDATACSHQIQQAQSHHPSTGLILTFTPSLGLVVIPPLIFIFEG